MPLTERLQPLASALADALSDPPSRVFVAYSGGKDSELLASFTANWLKQHPETPCTLLHVHHGLSAFADDWAAHCRRRAGHYGLPVEVISVELELGPRVSVEAAAREARYRAFANRLRPGEVLLTAHHRDDQTETLLLALKRGSGPLGLSGMKASQPLGQGRLLRPWLDVSQAEIQAAVDALGLNHIDDDSNADERFDRNFLRNHLLPTLNERWPGFSQAAARSAALCGEQQALCDELAQADLTQAELPCGGLSITPLAALSEARRNNLLRYWLKHQGALMPSRAQLVAMTPLWQARQDAQPELRWASHSVRRYRDGLYLLSNTPSDPPGDQPIDIQSPQTLLNGEIWCFEHRHSGPRLAPPLPGQAVEVRYGLPGSTRLKPAGRAGSRPLKKLWQEYGVPPWLRGRIAMLCFDGQVIAALGYWLEQDALCRTGPGLLPVMA